LVHAAEGNQALASFATAACALATMTGLAIWATGAPKLFCALIGTLIGYAAAAVFDTFPHSFFADYADTPAFAVPNPSFLSYTFVPSFAAPFAIAGLASGLRAIGVLTTCQQINDGSWRRPDMRNIAPACAPTGLGV
jgi:xanthine permease XanP